MLTLLGVALSMRLEMQVYSTKPVTPLKSTQTPTKRQKWKYRLMTTGTSHNPSSVTCSKSQPLLSLYDGRLRI